LASFLYKALFLNSSSGFICKIIGSFASAGGSAAGLFYGGTTSLVSEFFCCTG